jgi:hypothetical protein
VKTYKMYPEVSYQRGGGTTNENPRYEKLGVVPIVAVENVGNGQDVETCLSASTSSYQLAKIKEDRPLTGNRTGNVSTVPTTKIIIMSRRYLRKK